MDPKLNFSDIVGFAITNGLKNSISIIIALFLFLITCWIPYLNVGAFIAIANMPIILSKGKLISPTFIFDSKYRRQMGDYFIYIGISGMAILFAYPFTFGVASIILSFSWTLAPMLILDKGMNPIEALNLSNKYMRGHRRTTFLAILCIYLVLPVLVAMVGFGNPILAGFLGFILLLTILPIHLSALAYIYKTLVLDQEKQKEVHTQPIEIADELAKLSDLLERNIITFEEFEIRKQKLMNL